MSNTKTVMGQASNQYVVPLDITDVFSTYLYTGASSAQTITNGIDLDGEGGLTWIKARNFGSSSHALFDTERGGGKYLSSDTSLGEEAPASAPLTFNSDGFTVNTQADSWNGTYYSNTYASWTFRKAPKFFDVVTYTGDGVAGRTVSHNLGSVPGCIIVKRLDSGSSWCVYHQGQNGGVNPEQYRILLNSTSAEVDDLGSWNDTAPTDSVFSVGTTGNVNTPGGTYVAYLFAHNDGDGEFGPDADQDIIKCGSYTGNGSTDGPEINLGFEPQWILHKRTDSTSDWKLFDVMRGWTSVGSSGGTMNLLANSSGAEYDQGEDYIAPNSTGFKIANSGSEINASSGTYIYMAIRRGPLAPPESATDVFAIDTVGSTGDGKVPHLRASFPVDMSIRKRLSGGETAYNVARLISGKALSPDSTASELSIANFDFDYMNGWGNYTNTNSDYLGWMWKRAPNFFDVVAYTGDGVAGRTVSHNLGVASEMIWGKRRDSTGGWLVYHKDLSAGQYLFLNASQAPASYPFFGTQTSDGLVLNNAAAGTLNGSGEDYIAYLFASLDGVSKVGSYTGDGAGNRVIDCGFTSGARFILIKRIDGTGNWSVWDTERGILAGDVDARLELNTTDAEENSSNHIDPDPSGFKIISNFNTSGQEYIFYAIA